MGSRHVLGVTGAAGVFLGGCGNAWGTDWAQGNLVLLQVGPGPGANLTGVAANVTLREYRPGAGLTGLDLTLPSGPATGPSRLTMAGSETREGAMNLSADGRYLTFAGYDAEQFQSGVPAGFQIWRTNASSVNRVAARVSVSQQADLYRINDAHSQAPISAAASLDGSTFLTAGGFDGIRQLNPAGGNRSTTTFLSPNQFSSPKVIRYDLGNRVFATGITELGEVVNGTWQPLPGLLGVAGSQFEDFEFVGDSTLYIADNSVSQFGLQKWIFNGTTWIRSYRIPVSGGLKSIAIDDSGSTPVIYGVTSLVHITSLVRIVDTGAGSVVTTLLTADANYAFRGVEWVPVPTPWSASLLLGVCAGRRRR